MSAPRCELTTKVDLNNELAAARDESGEAIPDRPRWPRNHDFGTAPSERPRSLARLVTGLLVLLAAAALVTAVLLPGALAPVVALALPGSVWAGLGYTRREHSTNPAPGPDARARTTPPSDPDRGEHHRRGPPAIRPQVPRLRRGAMRAEERRGSPMSPPEHRAVLRMSLHRWFARDGQQRPSPALYEQTGRT